MKRTKLALISIFVFLTVFSLTVFIDIQHPFIFGKGNQTKTRDVASTKSDTLTGDTNGNDMQSFSVDISQSPDSLSSDTSSNPDLSLTGGADQTGSATVAAANDAAAKQEGEASAEVTPTAAPDETKTKDADTAAKEKSKYSDIGISIAKDYVNLREKPSTDSSILGKLYKGSAAKILKTKGDWYYVESGSVKGYLSTEFIKTGIPDNVLVDKYGTLSISVEVDGLNVRKKPSTDSKKLTVIYKDEIYPVVDVKDNWVEIKVPDEKLSGYVKKEFADIQIEFKEAVSKEEEQKLKQLQAEERAKKETEIKQQEGQDYTISDLELLACLIHAEAGSQSYEGKLAVANVVLNRVRSSRYPDSIRSVIYQSGQFSVAHSGSLAKQLNNYHYYDSSLQLMSIKAAKDALSGANNIGSRMYFHSYSAAVRKGYDDKESSVKIGGLLFW